MRSIPARKQRQVDRDVIGDYPPLEYDAARAGHFKPIAVRRRLAGVRAKFTARVLAVVEMNRGDVDSELLPYLPYRATDAATIQKQREDFRRIDGRRVA